MCVCVCVCVCIKVSSHSLNSEGKSNDLGKRKRKHPYCLKSSVPTIHISLLCLTLPLPSSCFPWFPPWVLDLAGPSYPFSPYLLLECLLRRMQGPGRALQMRRTEPATAVDLSDGYSSNFGHASGRGILEGKDSLGVGRAAILETIK